MEGELQAYMVFNLDVTVLFMEITMAIFALEKSFILKLVKTWVEFCPMHGVDKELKE